MKRFCNGGAVGRAQQVHTQDSPEFHTPRTESKGGQFQALEYTPSVLCLAHEFARNYFFSCERPILSKPIRLDSIGEDVHFDVYLQCSQKKSWVS